jgi:hypothetical protein
VGKRLIVFLVCAIGMLAAFGASAAETGGTTLRLKLQPDQVLVYRAVSDTEAKVSGGGGHGWGGRGDWGGGDSTSHLEMVFSLTAGQAGANNQTDVTIEILDATLVVEREWRNGRRRFEMNADGVKVYDGKKLVQQGAWGDFQVPGGVNLQTLLETPIHVALSDRAELKGMADAEEIRRLLQGANFLHLLRCMVVLPEGPVSKGSTWQVQQELAMANPLRLREIYKAPGTETYTAVEAVTYAKRSCLKVAIKGRWPRVDLQNGRAEADSSATGIVDFETGVTFALSIKSRHKIQGTVAGTEGDIDSKSTSTVEYVGGRATYDKYKGAEQQ